MTKLGVSSEKPKNGEAQVVITPYVIQPHLERRRKPSTLLVVVAVLLTILLTISTILGIIWIFKVSNSYWWITPTPTPEPVPPRQGKISSQSLHANPAANQPFGFEDIWDPKFRPKGFSGQWMSNNQLMYRDKVGDLVLMNVENNTDALEVLVNNDVFTENSVTSYYVSADTNYVLMAYDYLKVWRYSFEARYFIYDTQSADNPRIEFPNDAAVRSQGRLRYAGWAPNGHGLAFVINNDLYYQNGPSGNVTRITTDGASDPLYIFNGVPDWLYEEDVLGSRVAHYWSPDASHIVFAKFNDTGVPLVQYPLYGNVRNAYAGQYQAAYPKAGEIRDGKPGPNSRASLFVVAVSAPAVLKAIPVPADLQFVDHYYTRVGFLDNNQVLVTFTNRIQNEAFVQLCNIAANPVTCATNAKEFVPGGWIESPWPAPVTNENADGYFTYMINNDTQNGRWLHVAHITTPANGLGEIEWQTSGTHEVLGLVKYDKNSRYLYFYSTNGEQTDTHLMRVRRGNISSTECISCKVSACEYASASFSQSAEYFYLGCLGPEIPRYILMDASDLTEILVLEDNKDFASNISTRLMATRIFRKLQLDTNLAGSSEIFIPPNHVVGQSQHPLLVYAYAGPGSLRVTKRYPVGSSTNNWLTYLQSSHNIVVASIDARGSMGRGEDFKFQMYRRLGTIEVEDQITAGKLFKEQPDIMVNSNENAAIFGWSYGGMTSSHVMGRAQTEFKCGIAVAPVTSKRYYDTAYTERYMSLATPDDNEGGYNGTDVYPYAPNFKDKIYFIAHGTNDDNVHFRNYAMLIQALMQQDVSFRQQIYIDQDHSISSRFESRNLYRAMTDFLLNDCYISGYIPPTTPAVPTVPAGGSTYKANILMMALLALAVFLN